MARRALEELGRRDRVIAASRFSSAKAEQSLRAAGIETIKCNLLDRGAVAALPDAPNVVFMAGQKFGTRDAPSSTWAMNVVLPSIAAERYAASRIVAFSTGNVYALTPVRAGGSRESDTPAPVGEYAMSCLGRERVFEDAAARRGTPVAIVRLNYAVDLRYGVLVDIASRVLGGNPVDLRMGHVNVIWQGDANDWALRCLAHASATPPFLVNVTGRETLSVREIATLFGAMFGRAPVFTGAEAPDALLSNA
ncbi:MAG TPA: NAD-dependent epimerase/dehydratase family protein, partial [Polyangiaceae bacterium]